jgi:exodeoxyribonuclease V beta subunit
MPSGAHVGTFVHGVFEAADFAAPDLDAELAAQVTRVQARRQVEIGDRHGVIAGLRAAIETPLGPLLGGAALRDVPRADRLDELDFELPLVGGDVPTGRLTLAAIAAVLRRHVPEGDPLAGYSGRLEDPGLRPDVRGFLTGSIDLVARTTDAAGTSRFAVVDFKSNWLGTPGEDLTAWHYRAEALAAEMQRSHYVLQALLYTVALHRYLRWRLPGYDAGTHLDGIAYLFLRGMLGSGGPPTGVFTWRPTKALVEELSDVLDRGAA